MGCNVTPEEKLKHLPEKPGVYLFRDKSGMIIYVGKAVSLKNRVRSYYQAASTQSVKVRSMMTKAVDFEYIVTDSEVEALILESNLIKEHRPKYNIVLKDDKSYPYIKVTCAEEYPRVLIARKVLKDGSQYYGPYTRVGAVHETLALLRRLFPLRTCKQKEFANRGRPCLNYHIKRCVGPCTGAIAQDDYGAMVREVCLFLEGKQDELISRLTQRMKEAAEQLAFEEAAAIRDQLKAIAAVLEKQKIVSADRVDEDVIALAREGQAALPEETSLAQDLLCCLMIFFVRSGKLLGRERFMLERTAGERVEDVLSAFIKQYYHQADFIPSEVLVSQMDIDEGTLIGQWLSEKKGSKVQVKVPVKGEKKRLVDMVAKNAGLALEEARLEKLARRDGTEDVELLAQALDLAKPPLRMECFDISNMQGAETVASMAVFEEGKPASDQYRKFKIKTVQGPDDFASMQEALERRFRRGQEEIALINRGQLSSRQAKFHRMPDLLLIDGGKGQLSAAREVLEKLGLGHIPTYGLAKEEELLFAPDKSEPIRLPRNSRALYVLQRLRDEAHRFAVTFHRQLRTERNLKSLLDEIEGIGDVRRRELLKAFPTMEALAKASVEELAAVQGMNHKVAEAVREFFKQERERLSDGS